MSTRSDARDIAKCLAERIGNGEISSREDLIEAMHETVDSCGRVIYTARAREAVCEYGTSDYTDVFGEEGITRDGDINWAALAFCIVERLAYEELEALDINPNSPFACKACDNRHEHAEDAEDCCA